ncbi:nuclear transport factor 2 family protein [Nocardia tengchongensis]|uniref:nuclear transport factor 2 family protein n=1 Tax=Nocardia tengchongensis TaxID=2055889 RepID=UPI0036797DD9
MDNDTAAVIGLLHTYADALDRRDWAALDDVFAADVRADYAGSEIRTGAGDLVAMIRGYLDNCGPTQHLMGNERARISGDHATATVKMRVHHVAANAPDLTFEVFGWYHAEAQRTADGWRITAWRQEATHHVGTFEVFART